MLAGLKHAFTVKSFWLYLFVSFIGLGIFNGITTWVENIIRPPWLRRRTQAYLGFDAGGRGVGSSGHPAISG